jgi:hypothetical protein
MVTVALVVAVEVLVKLVLLELAKELLVKEGDKVELVEMDLTLGHLGYLQQVQE